MPALLIYLLKVNIALVLFYLAYCLALRRLTFYTLNRFFLLFGIIFSAGYPFVDLSDFLQQHEEISNQALLVMPVWEASAAKEPIQAFDYGRLLILLFWIGVGGMAVRLLGQLLSLYRMHRLSTPVTFRGYRFRRISGEVNAFSFGRAIYLNPDQHQPEELKAILQHEQIHVAEWHMLDVLLAELNLVVHWFNPGVWGMKQAVRENLEFITDRRVLQSGLDCKTYQYSLVRMSSLAQSSPLVNNFNFLSLKNRIAMMNKKQSSALQIAKYVLLLPLVITLALVFTISKGQIEKSTVGSAGIAAASANVTVTAQEPEPIYYVDGEEVGKGGLSTIEPGNIDNVQVLKGESATKVFGAKGDQGVVVITTKENKDSAKVRALNEKISQAGIGSAQNNQDLTTIKVTGENGSEISIRQGGSGPTPPPLDWSDKLILVDGKEVTAEAAKKISPDQIEKVEVLKNLNETGKDAANQDKKDLERIKKYREKARNGVILITTKKP